MSTPFHQGKIVSFNERDSCFIKYEDTKEPLFFDTSDLSGVLFKDLHIGDKLLFVVTQSLKGPYATNVSKVA